MSAPSWITVSQAAKKAGCSARTMRRKLSRLNKLSEGRLLRNIGETAVVRKWWVNAVVLEELLVRRRTAEPPEHELRSEVRALRVELEESAERLDVVELRTAAHRKRIAQHGATLKKHRLRIDSQEEVVSCLKIALDALSVATVKMSDWDDTEEKSDVHGSIVGQIRQG